MLSIGEQTKRFAATAMNDRSSRAHTVFILSLTQSKIIINNNNDIKISVKNNNNLITKKSKFFFADLG